MSPTPSKSLFAPETKTTNKEKTIKQRGIC